MPQYRTGELIYPVEVHSGSFLTSSHYSQSSKTGGYHTDGTLLDTIPEIAMLAGLSTADEGGETVIIDGYVLVDNLQNSYPNLLSILEQPHPFHSGDSAHDPITIHKVISHTNERMELRYMREYIEQGYVQIGQPLSENLPKALDALDGLAAAPDRQVTILIDRGHILLCNNFRFLHGRRPFSENHQSRRLRRAYGRHLSTPLGNRSGNHGVDLSPV